MAWIAIRHTGHHDSQTIASRFLADFNRDFALIDAGADVGQAVVEVISVSEIDCLVQIWESYSVCPEATRKEIQNVKYCAGFGDNRQSDD